MSKTPPGMNDAVDLTALKEELLANNEMPA